MPSLLRHHDVTLTDKRGPALLCRICLAFFTAWVLTLSIITIMLSRAATSATVIHNAPPGMPESPARPPTAPSVAVPALCSTDANFFLQPAEQCGGHVIGITCNGGCQMQMPIDPFRPRDVLVDFVEEQAAYFFDETLFLTQSSLMVTVALTNHLPPPSPCSAASVPPCLCEDDCNDLFVSIASNGRCNDGGPGSEWADCDLGKDCNDCGPRSTAALSSLSMMTRAAAMGNPRHFGELRLVGC